MIENTSSHFPEKLTVKDFFQNDAADVYLYDQFAVVEVKEGVTLSYASGFTLLVKGLKLYGNQPWIYVSNRINSYAVVPTDYKYLNKVPTLKGLVIVSPEKSKVNNAHLEKAFFKKPFKIVSNLEEAYEWGKQVLETKSRDKIEVIE
ncbi:MAG TPA: hypothetical protein EYN07_12280 [Flavobacteriaceae bacterium]|jgi:hypothetical protein|nr:hypothetical protein [Flavobacteriaceae bacterium]HIO00004.1 hypothetical protein [Flavobacteriaceae bacterium]|tara:strand:+ start:14481 stop:14921 length:441 start_codon:yes stop_codon:yes gene_type:complete